MLFVENTFSLCAYYTDETSSDSDDITEHSHDDRFVVWQFIHVINLNDHKLPYRRETLYSCTKCGKRFFVSHSALNKHKNIHMSKYKCSSLVSEHDTNLSFTELYWKIQWSQVNNWHGKCKGKESVQYLISLINLYLRHIFNFEKLP